MQEEKKRTREEMEKDLKELYRIKRSTGKSINFREMNVVFENGRQIQATAPTSSPSEVCSVTTRFFELIADYNFRFARLRGSIRKVGQDRRTFSYVTCSPSLF